MHIRARVHGVIDHFAGLKLLERGAERALVAEVMDEVHFERVIMAIDGVLRAKLVLGAPMKVEGAVKAAGSPAVVAPNAKNLGGLVKDRIRAFETARQENSNA